MTYKLCKTVTGILVERLKYECPLLSRTTVPVLRSARYIPWHIFLKIVIRYLSVIYYRAIVSDTGCAMNSVPGQALKVAHRALERISADSYLKRIGFYRRCRKQHCQLRIYHNAVFRDWRQWLDLHDHLAGSVRISVISAAQYFRIRRALAVRHVLPQVCGLHVTDFIMKINTRINNHRECSAWGVYPLRTCNEP